MPPHSSVFDSYFILYAGLDKVNLCVYSFSMAHINLLRSTKWEMRDWLRVLNWRPQREGAVLRVWLPSLGGPGASRAAVTRQDAERLRHFVDAWLLSKRDITKLPVGKLEDLKKHLQPVKAFWGTTRNGGLVPAWSDDTESPGFDVAVGLFARISADADRWRLCGPCAECSRYFLSKTRRSPKYCKVACRRRESRPRMQAARKKQHEASLAIVRELVAEWKRRERGDDWKAWTARKHNQRIDGTDLEPITGKTLTRWVNRGELKLPATEEKHQKADN